MRISSTPNQLVGLEILIGVLLLQYGRVVDAFGYSYSRFIGPVRGPERQIIVHDRYDGRGRIDYVARPEYQFAYGVEDAKTRVLQNHRETRNGDAVKGVYSVVDPDGTLRVVKYTSDNVNGFQAEVISNGVSRIHGQENPVVHLPQPVDAAVVDGKDNRNLHQHQQQIQVQHPDGDVHSVTEGKENEGVDDAVKTPAEVDEEDEDDDREANDSSSVSKETSDYEDRQEDEEEEDGGEEDSDEVEDYQ